MSTEATIRATAEMHIDRLGVTLARAGEDPRYNTRDAFVQRVSDVLRRTGVEDAELLVRRLETHLLPACAHCGSFALSATKVHRALEMRRSPRIRRDSQLCEPCARMRGVLRAGITRQRNRDRAAGETS